MFGDVTRTLIHTHTHTDARARARARACVCVCVCVARTVALLVNGLLFLFLKRKRSAFSSILKAKCLFLSKKPRKEITETLRKACSVEHRSEGYKGVVALSVVTKI